MAASCSGRAQAAAGDLARPEHELDVEVRLLAHEEPDELRQRAVVGIGALAFQELRRAFASGLKAFVLCNPSNPCGRVFTREELLQIAALAEVRALVIEERDDIAPEYTVPRWLSPLQLFREQRSSRPRRACGRARIAASRRAPGNHRNSR